MTRRTVAETTGSLGDDYQSVEAARGDSGQLLGESGMKAIGDGLSRIAERLSDVASRPKEFAAAEATVPTSAAVAATPVAPGGLERGLKYMANAAVVIALIFVASNHVRDLK
jgi:hypothetical protein